MSLVTDEALEAVKAVLEDKHLNTMDFAIDQLVQPKHQIVILLVECAVSTYYLYSVFLTAFLIIAVSIGPVVFVFGSKF